MTETIYICLYEPEGELRYDDITRVLGVFTTIEQARERLIKEIDYDIQHNEYVVDKDDYDNFKNGENMWINVFYQNEDYRQYYCMTIIQSEVNL